MAIAPDNHRPATIDETDNWHETYTVWWARRGLAWRSCPLSRIRSSERAGARPGEGRPRLTDLSLHHFWHVRDNDGREGGREGAMMMYEGNNWHDWVIISDGRSVGCSGRLMRWAVRETEIYWSVRCLLKSADREIKHGRPFCLVATRCRGCHSSIHILQTFMSIRNIGIVICVYWEYCLSAPNSYCMSLSPAKRFIVLVLLNLNRYR